MFTKVLIFVIQFQNVATGSAILSNLNNSILFNSKQTHALPNNVRWPMSRLSKMDWSLRSAEPAPMRRVKCLPCLTWDWWRVTSEKRCCLIPSGYGNSHLLLTTINTAGPNTVSAAEQSYCTMKSFWIFVFVSATSWSSLVIRSQHVCRAAKFWQRMLANRQFKHAYLMNCSLNFHWNDKISIAHWLLKKGCIYRFTISQWCNREYVTATS